MLVDSRTSSRELTNSIGKPVPQLNLHKPTPAGYWDIDFISRIIEEMESTASQAHRIVSFLDAIPVLATL